MLSDTNHDALRLGYQYLNSWLVWLELCEFTLVGFVNDYGCCGFEQEVLLEATGLAGGRLGNPDFLGVEW